MSMKYLDATGNWTVPSDEPPAPLDPDEVYTETRPTDWMQIPEPSENEMYLLFFVPVGGFQHLAFEITTSDSSAITFEYGTVQESVFTAIGNESITSGEVFECDFGDSEVIRPGETGITMYDVSTCPNTDDTVYKQVMIKLSSTADIKTFSPCESKVLKSATENTRQVLFSIYNVMEISTNLPHVSTLLMCDKNVRSGYDKAYISFSNLTYFTLYGESEITNYSAMFFKCMSLIAVRFVNASTSKGTNFSYMFNDCYSLLAIPQLDTSQGVNFSRIFYNCRSLMAVYPLDTSSGTNFSNMFAGNNSIKSIPQLDTSSGTDFSHMFSDCNCIKTIPELNTSLGSNFSYMFFRCYLLTAIPQLDTSSGTIFTGMFSICSSLTTIPQLDTSSGTEFSYMFNSCYSLVTVPQLNTSQGIRFSSMFSSCYSLRAIPKLNTSLGADFSGMFSTCSSLTTIPQLNTSSGTIFSSMLSYCSSLTTVPELDTSNGTSFSNMFTSDCMITTIPKLDTSQGNNFSNMFSDCYSLTSIPEMSVTSSATTLKSMFSSCYDLVDISNAKEWDTSNVTNMDSMFENCKSVKDFTPLGIWDTNNVISDNNMFNGCTAPTPIWGLYGVDFADFPTSTKGTRTDGSVSFDEPVPALSTSEGSSPFDKLRPWAGIKRITRSGNEMVEIPRFWYKLTQSGSGVKIQISSRKADGFSVSPAHMDRGDGKGEREKIYIGRYHSSSNYKSVTKKTPIVNITHSAARTGCQGVGTGFYMMDFATRFTLWLLYLVEYADWNSQAIIGYGGGDNTAIETMGYTDDMTYHTGTSQEAKDTQAIGTQYRWIEGLWDNCYDWLDGIYNASDGIYTTVNPTEFADDSGGTLATGETTPANGWIMKLQVSEAGKFPIFYNTDTTSGAKDKGGCDYWNFSATSPCIFGGGNYGTSDSRGLFCINHASTTTSNDYTGVRLMELP